MFTSVTLASCASCSLVFRDTSDTVTALQGELEEGHRRQRAGENRQVEHPFSAHRLPFLQLSCRHRRREQAGGILAARLANEQRGLQGQTSPVLFV